MLRFAVPALGISLAGPIMTNIDNAFVGRLCGTAALAAMSPGTVLSDYILYLFIFLPRATIGLVARSRAQGQIAVRRELSRALSAALLVGVALTLMYLVATPALLALFGVSSELMRDASAYVRIRGLVAWAALMQSVALSGLLATRDSVTPLKVVIIAACLNFAGDWLLCVWPLQLGVAGAAWATALSTLAGFSLMLQALHRKGLSPELRVLRKADLVPLLEYARPLAVVILTRFIGLTCMAMAAGTRGTTSVAAYQVLANVLILFGLCGEPLSQIAQTMLPSLLDEQVNDGKPAAKFLKNLFLLAMCVGLIAGCSAWCFMRYASSSFTRDAHVLHIVRQTAPVVAVCIASLVLQQPLDGTLVAAREFSFVIKLSVITMLSQLCVLSAVLHFNLGLSFVFLSLAVRYWVFTVSASLRVLKGKGSLGRAVRSSPSH